MQPLWKSVWRVFRKLRVELPYDPAVALPGLYPRDANTVIRRGTCTTVPVAAMSATANIWQDTRCPSMDEGIKERGRVYGVYIYDGIALSHQKCKLLPFATPWMELEGLTLCEISHSEKDKYHMISLMCGV